jgi:hypothetical protein
MLKARPVLKEWVQLEKSLRDDPVILVMADTLRARANGYAGELGPNARNFFITTCVGAVGILWITADSHVDQNDILPLGPAHIDEITGIQGFCELLPPEWLQVIDSKHVKLPGFQAHRSSAAKRKAQGAARQRRFRNGQALRARH